jgi:response regulator RpfG family c-di-GMP phosphodiesterase
MTPPQNSTDRVFRILVVEDDPDLLSITVQILRRAQYEVLEASDGAQGLRLALESRPDLVLSDMVLPKMNGAELCRQIKAAPELEGTFFVVLSAMRTSPGEQAEGLELGADGYIVRPIANRELLARVAALIRIKRAEDERDHLIEELKAALARIKTLSGLIPICTHCKKVRDDRGYWEQVEAFVSRHSDAEFTHGLCPVCVEKLYPDWARLRSPVRTK